LKPDGPEDPKPVRAQDTTGEIAIPIAAPRAAEPLVRAALARDTTAELAPPLPPVRDQAASLGRYELRRKLGEGTFGVVHEALDRSTGKVVALKALAPGTSPEAIARFEREALAAKRLDHPGIVRVLDVGTQDGASFITFELVAGRSLEAAVEERGALPEAEALGLAQALALALAHAHERGVLHRDVSPGNVLLAAGARPVLADFGLAKDLLAPDVLTRTGDVLGTMGCMAPELLTGGAARADERADVFGLGAVLHFCLAGELPGRARSLAELLVEIDRGFPPPPGVSMATAGLLRAALRPKREERMASATAFAEGCAAALAALALDPHAPGNEPPPSSETEKIPSAPALPRQPDPPPVTPAVAVTALVLLLAAVILVAAGLLRRNAAARTRAEALSILAGAEDRSPFEEAAAATRALELAPGLEEAYALRALARAHEGDLVRADLDLARAGDGEPARRARAWVALRRGETNAALALIAGTRFDRDVERLTFAAGLVPDHARDPVRLALATDGDLAAFTTAELEAAGPAVAGAVWLRRGELGLARRELDRALASGPGTIDGHEALLLRARLSSVELDDEGVARDLARALEAPPRERALAVALREKLASVALGSDGLDSAPEPRDPVDRALALAARELARVELERHRLTERAPDLARATKRLRRALALSPDAWSARALLARGLARRPRENEAALGKLASSLDGDARTWHAQVEAARIRLALGDETGARAALDRRGAAGRQGERLATGLRAVLEGDAACARAYLEIEEPLDQESLAAASRATRALVLDRLSEAQEPLERLSLGHGSRRLHLELAASRCARDPAGALAALARAWPHPPSGEACALADAIALSLAKDGRVADALVARGLSADEARAAVALIAGERPHLAELEGATWASLEKALAANELDPLRLDREPGLAPLRSDRRWGELLGAAAR
jgi:hypothetical protein